MSSPPPWKPLEWSRRLRAVARNGLHYARDPHDQARYEEVARVAAELLAAASGEPPAQLAALTAREVGHATPKLGVRAAVFRDDRILLVRERADGLWTVPGGWADVGEAPAAGAAREVQEESGFTVEPVKLALVHDQSLHGGVPHPEQVVKLFYLCRLTVGTARSSDETDAVDFFSADDLPPLSPLRVTREQVRLLFAHHRDPGRPTDFD